jgi:hypothetical protein
MYKAYLERYKIKAQPNLFHINMDTKGPFTLAVI